MLSHPMFKWTHGQLLTYAAAAAIAAFVIGAGAGLWAGMRWQKGAQALADIAAARNEAAELRQDHRDQLQDLRTVADRFNVISGELEHARTALRRSIDENATVVAAFLADHPELGACDIGPDGLRLWNEALRPAGAAAPDADAPDGAVRAPAAGTRQRAADAVDQPPAGGGLGAGMRAAVRSTGAGGARPGSAGTGTLRTGDHAATARSEAQALALLAELRGFRE